jgi:hypothetical protein
MHPDRVFIDLDNIKIPDHQVLLDQFFGESVQLYGYGGIEARRTERILRF